MKRDMDLIRNMLLEIEKAENVVSLDKLREMHVNENVVDYHVWLLDEAGYVDSTLMYADNGLYYASINGLTWAGQDFLDAIRGKNMWDKIKRAVSACTDSTTFEVIKGVAVKYAQAEILSKMGV